MGPKPWSRDDWYSDGEEQLHFFPGKKRLVFTRGKQIVAEAPAWGGVNVKHWNRADGMRPRETTPGTYILSRVLDPRAHDSNGDDMPDTWVFNDFGPYAVRYFRDDNRNRKLDPGERLKGEMIHTTPDNEAQEAQNQPVQLIPSHGCVHIKPADRDRFLNLRASTPGYLFVVHAPTDVVPELLSRAE